MTDGIKSRKGCARACDRCRRSKIRCSADTVNEFGKCRRCYQAGTDCVFPSSTPAQQRRRRTDARVASLERQLDDLTSLLANQTTSPDGLLAASASPHDFHVVSESSSQLDELPVHRYANGHAVIQPLETTSAVPGSKLVSVQQLTSEDDDAIPGYIASSLLPLDRAMQLFSTFHSHVIDEYPIIALDQNESFEELRHKKPILLYAIITAACRGRLPYIFNQLHSQLQRLLLGKVMLEGQKSLELIQAILLLEVWYCLPNDLNHLSFYQWTHMAGTMGLHIGLLGSVDPRSTHIGLTDDRMPDVAYQPQSWRTALAICVSVSTVAISLHREPMLTVSKSAISSLKALEANVTLTNDRRLIAWATLQILAEEVENKKKELCNKSAQPGSRHDLQTLENHFDVWWQTLPEEVLNVSLEIHYLYCRCRFYELAMINSQLPREGSAFIDGSTSKSIETIGNAQRRVTPASVKAIMSIVDFCHRLINRLICIDTIQYLDLPTVTTMRVLYAVNTLSTLQKLSKNPKHTVSHIIDDDTIMLDKNVTQFRDYLKKVLSHGDEHKVPCVVLHSLDRIVAQPYLCQSQTPESQHLGEHSHIDEQDNTPRNDFEAVVVSSLPQREESEHVHQYRPAGLPRIDLSTANQSFSPAHQQSNEASGIGPYTFDTDTSLRNTGNSDFELMCMPELFSGVNPWLADGQNGMAHFSDDLNTGMTGSAYNAYNWG